METLNWNELDDGQRKAALARAPQNRAAGTQKIVSDILQRVCDEGDSAIVELTKRLDGVDFLANQFHVDDSQRDAAIAGLDATVRSAIDEAYSNIAKFHQAAMPKNISVETVPGVICQARYVGIDRVGLYAPGGATPLPSSVLMMGVPAKLAGCRELILCTSPGKDGSIDAAIAYAAQLCGVTSIFQVGGAQAIAAMAFGTATVPACDKLFGPGSIWVTEAKRQIANGDNSVTIDMAAGPSEVLVIADADADEEFVAADLVAQIEHGRDSQAILVTDCSQFASRVIEAVQRLASQLSREELIRDSLNYSRAIIVSDMNQAIEVANRYAAEHLIIQTADPEKLLDGVTAAGSIFLGAWTPEVLGDYCSGTNHVLPTCGLARSVNGLSATDFMKRITVQQATASGLNNLAGTAITLANWENLTAHAHAVIVRQNAMSDKVSS